MVRSRAVALGVAGILQMGCATGAANTDVGMARPSRRANVLMVSEIRERAPGARSALDAIRQLRNGWVRGALQTRSFRDNPTLRVYLDNVSVGQGPEWLQGMPVERVAELRYWSPNEATQRWGTGHALGAIEVVTASAVVTSRDPASGVARVDEPDVAPIDLHAVRAVWSAHGNTAIITSPTELANVWAPAPSVGIALGIEASPTVTFSAGFDLNRFTFSQSGTLQYLINRPTRSLKSTENVQVAGGSTVLLNLTANVRVHPRSGAFRPYLYGSAGYGRLDIAPFSITGADGQPLPASQFPLQSAEGGDQVENSFTFGGGGGVEWRLTASLRAFADLRYMTAIRGPRYRDVYDDFQLFNTSYLPVRFGVAFR